MALRKNLAAIALDSDAIKQQAMGWVIKHMATSFCVGEPQHVVAQNAWRVPIMLAYPFMVVGQVGEVWVDAVSGKVLRHTSLQTMRATARQLGTQHDAEIQAAFIQARDS
jgi:hypothetical protein